MESNNKKAYKLWWEFLRLSDKYKKFYDFQMKLKTQWKSKPQKTHVHTIFFEWDSESYKFFIKEPVEVNLKKGVFPEGLIQTCFIFGNVHELSFEVFWKNLEGRRQKIYIKKKIPVSEFKGDFEFWSSLYEHICKVRSKNPNYEDFKKLMLNCLKNKEARYLTIDLRCSISDINNSIKQFVNKDVKKELRDKIINNQWRKCYFYCFPTPNLRIDEVSRYLKVLKVFKSGLQGKSAFKELYPKGDYNDPDQRTAFYSDKRKAERILKNVEKGYFPGIYEKKTKKHSS